MLLILRHMSYLRNAMNYAFKKQLGADLSSTSSVLRFFENSMLANWRGSEALTFFKSHIFGPLILDNQIVK